VQINGNHQQRTSAVRSVCDPSVPHTLPVSVLYKISEHSKTESDCCKCTCRHIIIVRDGSVCSLPNVEAGSTFICG